MGIRPGQAKGPYVGLDGSSQGIQSVISLFNPTTAFPLSPTNGDSYIATATATHSGVTWTAGNIYTWNGLTWVETLPYDGMFRYAVHLDQLYVYNTNAWVIYPNHWLEPVISIYDNTGALPAPAVADRYIALVTANGWTAKSVYEWDGVQWVATAPTEGAAVVVKDLKDAYAYLGGAWTVVEDAWLDPVISIYDNTLALPVASLGDRYIALVTANGWVANSVYEWNTLNWVRTTPATGMMIFNNAIGNPFLYTGSAWVEFKPLTAHAATHAIGGGDTIALQTAATAAQHYTGFPNRTDSSIGFTDGTRTFALTGTFDVYGLSVKYTPTAPQKSIVISNVTGLHWIWYTFPGGVPTLNDSLSAPGFEACIVAAIYWNASTAKGRLLDERHSSGRDPLNHEYNHRTFGTRYASGLAGAFTNTTFSISAGEIWDEDIRFVITPLQTTLDILYFNGSTAWEWDDASVTPYKLNGTTMRYNNGTALADIGPNNYGVYWLFAVDSLTKPIITIMGQAEYSTLALAQAASPSSLSIPVLPANEMKLCYKLIYRRTGVNTVFTEAVDYRSGVATAVSGFTVADHSTLSNLGYATAGHSGFYTRADAEISTTIPKVSPTTSDLLLIEDAAASNAKKSITIGSLPAAAPASHGIADSTKHTAAGITAGQMLKADANGLPTNATNTDAEVAARLGLMKQEAVSGGAVTYVQGYYGTGAPPAAAGKPDGTLFFKYI